MPTFGKVVAGAFGWNDPGDWICGTVYNCPDNCNVFNMSLYVNRITGGGKSARMLIYSDNVGEPNLLMGVSDDFVPAVGWCDAAADIDLVIGDYWLMFWMDTWDGVTEWQIAYDAAGSGVYVADDWTTPPPDPYPAHFDIAREVSIHADYNVVVGGGKSGGVVNAASVLLNPASKMLFGFADRFPKLKPRWVA